MNDLDNEAYTVQQISNTYTLYVPITHRNSLCKSLHQGHTRVAKASPGVVVLTVSADVEHPVDGRRPAEALPTVPVALPALHSQARLPIRLISGS